MAFPPNAARGPPQTDLCLRYPDDLQPQPNLPLEHAANLLFKAIELAMRHPFAWMPIDKPQEGQIFIVFNLPNQPPVYVNDGIRYMEQEQRYTVQAGGGREMEVFEVKFGFIPNSADTTADRLRRRYRFVKGGHPSLMLVHYSRGQGAAINPPTLLKEPVRIYPVPRSNEPRVFVYGDRVGQKVPASGPTQMPGAGAGPGTAIRLSERMAVQKAQMEALNRRELPQREHPMEEFDDDELENITARSLAVTRYKRNHELMNEVFWRASRGDKKTVERVNPYTMFDQAEMEEKIKKLEAEIDRLQTKESMRTESSRREDIIASTEDREWAM